MPLCFAATDLLPRILTVYLCKSASPTHSVKKTHFFITPLQVMPADRPLPQAATGLHASSSSGSSRPAIWLATSASRSRLRTSLNLFRSVSIAALAALRAASALTLTYCGGPRGPSSICDSSTLSRRQAPDSARRSYSSTTLTTVPLAPNRPARPALCAYCRQSDAASSWTTLCAVGRSRPRAPRSVRRRALRAGPGLRKAASAAWRAWLGRSPWRACIWGGGW